MSLLTYQGKLLSQGGHFVSSPMPDQVWVGAYLWKTKNVSDIIIVSNPDPNLATSRVYGDNEANRELYGGLYTAEMIPSILALYPGWGIATTIAFEDMITTLGGASVTGGYIKEAGTTYWNPPNTDADNIAGWYGRGGGYYLSPMYDYYDLKNYGYWWATDGPNPIKQYVLSYDNGTFSSQTDADTNFYSVRLVTD